MRPGLRLALLCAGALAACGRYGPPVRSSAAEPAAPAAAQPAAPGAAPAELPETPIEEVP